MNKGITDVQFDPIAGIQSVDMDIETGFIETGFFDTGISSYEALQNDLPINLEPNQELPNQEPLNQELPNDLPLNLEPNQELPNQELPAGVKSIRLMAEICRLDEQINQAICKRDELNVEFARLQEQASLELEGLKSDDLELLNDPERIKLIEEIHQLDEQINQANCKKDELNVEYQNERERIALIEEIRRLDVEYQALADNALPEILINITYPLILWRMTHMSLLSDMMNIAILYMYCNISANATHNFAAKCIGIKLALWVVPFVIRMFIQPIIDYVHMPQSLKTSELENITILHKNESKAIIVFFTIVFLFADIVIIAKFIPVTNSCDYYSYEMCTIQKIYAIICIVSYTIIGIGCLFAGGYSMYPQLQTILNERTFRLNISSLQHLILSETEDKCCAICLDDIENALVLHCGHKFHDECITGWIKKKGTCPTCFQPVFDKCTTDLHNTTKNTIIKEEHKDEHKDIDENDKSSAIQLNVVHVNDVANMV
jgi:hypothetical protein